MARRKRLTLPDPAILAAAPAPETKSLFPALGAGRAPIAQVAGEASAVQALEELAEAMRTARQQGRLVQMLPLDSIEEGHLIRDRLGTDPQDMADLVASIRARGQQAPIEVVALEGGRFGLISGWRRLRALRALHAETGEARFGTVLALLRWPESAADAYRAMVEENEIRAGLSYYERARIAARAAEAGVHADPRAAIAALFAAASPARRSKIGSFLVLYQALDDRLRFAPAIPERLGLALARALDRDPGLRARLRERLRKGAPQTAAAELALLERALSGRGQADGGRRQDPAPRPREGDPEANRRASATPPGRGQEIRPGLWLETVSGDGTGRLVLHGPGVDGALREALVRWLRDQG